EEVDLRGVRTGADAHRARLVRHARAEAARHALVLRRDRAHLLRLVAGPRSAALVGRTTRVPGHRRAFAAGADLVDRAPLAVVARRALVRGDRRADAVAVHARARRADVREVARAALVDRHRHAPDADVAGRRETVVGELLALVGGERAHARGARARVV